MTKLEYVLSKKGSKKERCIYAAFNLTPENAEEICNYYDLAYTDFPFPHICMQIIKKEYGNKVDSLTGKYIGYLIKSMIQSSTPSEIFEQDIIETVNDFINFY